MGCALGASDRWVVNHGNAQGNGMFFDKYPLHPTEPSTSRTYDTKDSRLGKLFSLPKPFIEAAKAGDTNRVKTIVNKEGDSIFN
jgi:hypothetical protein